MKTSPLWNQFISDHNISRVADQLDFDSPGALTPLLSLPTHPWYHFEAVHNASVLYEVDYFPARNSWLIVRDGEIYDVQLRAFQNPTLSLEQLKLPGKGSPLCLVFPQRLFRHIQISPYERENAYYYAIHVADEFYYHYESGRLEEKNRPDKRSFSEVIVPSFGGYALHFRETIEDEIFIDWRMESITSVPAERFTNFTQQYSELLSSIH